VDVKPTPFRLVLALLAGAALVVSSARLAAADSTVAPTEGKHFVIVHGAWGGGWAFREVEKLLRAEGHQVHRVTLTGQGERAHLASPEIDLALHIQDVVSVLEFEELEEIVLVGHSYGGMVITGVADRVYPRIEHTVYLDAILPVDGESVQTVMGRGMTEEGGFIVPRWVQPDQKPPHDVPQSVKTFSQPIALKHQDEVAKLPSTYVLTVDPGKQPEDDSFFPSSARARARGWPVLVMEADHNPQWSKPTELAALLVKIATARP
jgi:pimeloyl-ACP methyl ester carboxylesterase